MDKALLVCDSVARKITPSKAEQERVSRIAERLRAGLIAECARQGLEAEVRLDGSVAKDTWLRGDADIDIFMRVPAPVSRAELEGRCLDIARRALKGHRIIERFAEHPYVETHVDDTRVNVVPCYDVPRGEWRSATDRTPFHTDYVISHLTPNQKREVRLLKAFLKGIGVYGADVKVSGFSGILCETLVMHFGSFTESLQKAQSWRAPVVIDLEHYYTGRESELLDLFEEPLVVIDPVDRGRNLAASISHRSLWEFVAAARAFTKNPKRRFFTASRLAPLTVARFRREMQRRGWNLVVIRIGRVDAVVDVLWSQLYRTERALRNLLRQEGFNVTRSASWSDEESLSLIIFELENTKLPPVRKHIGPHVSRLQASELFVQKHLKEPRSISGPWVDDDRWAVDQLRQNVDAEKFLRSRLHDGGRNIGVASKIAPLLKRRCDILAERKLVSLYRSDGDVARFLTCFLRGRPAWVA